MDKIKVCPMCGSTHIHYVAGMVTGEKYRCEDCGYIGSFIIEMSIEEYEKWMEDKRRERDEAER